MWGSWQLLEMQYVPRHAHEMDEMDEGNTLRTSSAYWALFWKCKLE